VVFQQAGESVGKGKPSVHLEGAYAH